MSDEIRQFIAENREIAKTQAERWQGVDPSRLLQALDYLEGMLDSAPAVSLNGTRYFDASLIRYARVAEQAEETLKDVASLHQELSQGTDLTVTQLGVERNIDSPKTVHISIEASGYVQSWQIEQLIADMQNRLLKARLR